MCRALQALCRIGQLDKALQALSLTPSPPPSASTYISLLRECKKQRSIGHAKQLQTHLASHHIPLTGLLGDHLVMTLASCGALEDALHTSYALPHRSVFSWTSIISACVDSGHPHDALTMYQHMLDDHIEPDRYTFVSLLKACGSIPDLALGKKMHAHARQKGIVHDLFVDNTLISMYGKCGDITEAEKVFIEMPVRTVISWNSMMSAYLDHGRGETTLQMYSHMHSQGANPDHSTSTLALQACAALAENCYLVDGKSIMLLSLEIGQALHSEMRRKGFASHIFVASTLVNLYGKCKAIAEAQHVFSALSHYDVVSWNVILAAYVEQGQGERALQLYVLMQGSGTSPDRMSFMIALQACAVLAEKEHLFFMKESTMKLATLEIGQALHSDAQIMGVASDAFVGNTLVSMYGKCGAIIEAEQVFSTLLHHDAVSWNAMLSAYVEQGEGEKALSLYLQMQENDVIPDQLTFMIALQACAVVAETSESILEGGQMMKVVPLAIGKALHADVRRKGFECDGLIGCTLVSMYGKCGATAEAEHMFTVLSLHDVVSWNVILSTYVDQGKGNVVLQLFAYMQNEGVSPDQVTLVTAIQACAILVEMELSKAMCLEICTTLHADACKKGFSIQAFVNNTLVNVYGKCDATLEAEHVFQAMSQRTVVSWNAILSSYVEKSQGERALQLYVHMQREGVGSDQLTCVIALQACASIADEEAAVFVEGTSTKVKALKVGNMLYADAVKRGYTSDVIVANTLVSMFGKCGTILQARHVFDGMPERSIVSWNVMLSAYLEQGQGEDALQLYREMRKQGVILDHITPICALQACSVVGSLELCEQIHFDIVAAGYDYFSSLTAPLIHAYGSCAKMVEAQEFFDKIVKPDVTLWNACIAGYTGEGNHAASILTFEELKLGGVKPDEVTLTSVLSACSHSGLVLEGLELFESMRRDYSLASGSMHYGCMLDLLGRVGDFNRLENILNNFPIHTDVTIWQCLLAACRTHGNLDLAQLAFNCAVNLQPKQSTPYVLMSNMCANAGLWEGLDDIEMLRKRQGNSCVDGG